MDMLAFLRNPYNIIWNQPKHSGDCAYSLRLYKKRRGTSEACHRLALREEQKENNKMEVKEDVEGKDEFSNKVEG